MKLISGKYESYSKALKDLNLETLKERRYMLTKRFSDKCVNNERTKHIFQLQKKDHTMKLRNSNRYKIINARTARMEKSAMPRMIEHLNKKHKENKRMHDKYSL